MSPNYVDASRSRADRALKRLEIELRKRELSLKEREIELTHGRKLHITPTLGTIIVAIVGAVGVVGGHYLDELKSSLEAKQKSEDARYAADLAAKTAKSHDEVEFISKLVVTVAQYPNSPDVIQPFIKAAIEKGIVTSQSIDLAKLGPPKLQNVENIEVNHTKPADAILCLAIVPPADKPHEKLLSGNDFGLLLMDFHLDLPTLKAFIATETSGSGFLADGRPKILFERHLFHRYTGGKYDTINPGISNPTAGGYGLGGAHQYERVQEAAKLECNGALQSTSWGLTQILGFNYRMAGAETIEAFVKLQATSEFEQLKSGLTFLSTSGLLKLLQNKDWEGFSRRYNGPSTAVNYGALLENFYAKFSEAPDPNEEIKVAKERLRKIGYYDGAITQDWNIDFEFSLRRFQWKSGLPLDGVLGLQTKEELAKAARA